jgi:glycosyltransferase involved in cell wall biosynthesis
VRSQITSPSISLVIPAYNEAALLPRLLASVRVAAERFEGGADRIEVIVADNCSTDDTAAIALAADCRVVPAEIRCIAAARNAGARAARGELLCFVDADSQIHPDTFNVIAAHMRSADVIGGATGVRPERWSVGIALSYAMFIPVIAATRIDTGVVFCRREDFETIGGYDETMKFAEDVRFHVDMWLLGRKRGARLVRASRAKAVFSTRKFDRFGEWHYLPLMLKAPWYLLNRRAGNTLAQRYWYQPGR